MAAHHILLESMDVKIFNVFVSLAFMIIKIILWIDFSFFIIFPIEILYDFWKVKFGIWIFTNLLLNLMKRRLKNVIFEAKYINYQLI